MVSNQRSSIQSRVDEKGQYRTMSSHSLSGDYLRWLCAQIRGDRDGNPNRTYDGLCVIMYETEFIELVPNDGNRIGDGLDLRVEFCQQQGFAKRRIGDFLAKEGPNPPCSFLEVLIGLSRRLAWNAGGSAEGWAWELMCNLTLHRLGDPVGRTRARKIHRILEGCIRREYDPDGRGGFFPLEQPLEDQRKVELWYQMAAFIDEIHRR